MTLRHVDSMALYNSMAEAVASGKWTATSSAGGGEALRAAGRNTGAYSLLCPSGGRGFQRDFSTESWVGANVGIIVGFAMKPVGSFTASPAAQQIELFDKNTNTSGWMINVDSATVLSLHLGTGTAGTWGSSVATTACSTSTWDYHEIKVLPGGTNGAASRVIWKKNGTQVYDSGAGAVDIKSSTMNQLNLGQSFSAAGNGSSYFTDLYVCDTTGGNADFLGDTRIECLLPTGDGHRQDLTATVQNLMTLDRYNMEASLAWNTYSGTVSRTTAWAYSGTQALLCNRPSTSAGTATTGTSPAAGGAIPVVGGQTYTMAWRYNNPTGVSLLGEVSIINLDANGNSLGSGSNVTVDPSYASGAIGSDSVTFTTDVLAKFIEVRIGVVNSGGTLYFDEIGVYPGSTAYYQPPGAWGNVSELPKNDDTSYVHGGTDGSIQTFQMSDLNSVSGNVVGVVVNPWVRAENTGTRQLQPVFGGPGGVGETSFLEARAADEGWDAGNTSSHVTPASVVREDDELFIVTVGPGSGFYNSLSGWTVLQSDLHLHPYGDVYVSLLHRVASSTDANRIWQVGDGTHTLQDLFYFAYRGCKYVSNSVNFGLVNSQSTPSVTPTNASTIVDLFILNAQSLGLSAVISGPSSPVTNRSPSGVNTGSGYTDAWIGDETVAAGGTGGNRTATTTNSATNSAFFGFSIVLEGVASSVGSTASPGTLNNDLAYHLTPLIVESNPITTAAWTIADVNAVEAGVKLN